MKPSPSATESTPLFYFNHPHAINSSEPDTTQHANQTVFKTQTASRPKKRGQRAGSTSIRKFGSRSGKKGISGKQEAIQDGNKKLRIEETSVANGPEAGVA